MADTKISALAAVVTPADTDEFAVNQSAVSKKMTLGQVWTPSGTVTTDGRLGYDATAHRVTSGDSQRARTLGSLGWCPYAYPIGSNPASAWTTAFTVATGVVLVIPMSVSGQMLLRSVSIRELSATLARSWSWALYLQDLNNGNAGENSLRRVAASAAADTWTAAAAQTRTSAAGSAPVYIAPGTYWLAIRSDQGTNNISVGTVATNTLALDMAQTKTTTLSDPLDMVAASWTKVTGNCFGARLNGDVFGQTAAF